MINFCLVLLCLCPPLNSVELRLFVLLAQRAELVKMVPIIFFLFGLLDTDIGAIIRTL